MGYGIVSGLESLVGGAQAGQQEQKKREEQARRDLLQQKLLEAQTADVQAQTTQRLRTPVAKKQPPHTVWTDKGLLQWDEATNTWAPATMQGSAPQAPIRQPQKTAKPATVKPLTVVERETKAAARTALDLVRKMRAQHTANPQNSQLSFGASALRGVGNLPVVGTALSGLTGPAAQQFMTPGQAGYQQEADQLLHLASSVLPKGGRSIALLNNLRASFTSAAGAKNPEAAQQALAEQENQLTEVLGEGPVPAPPSAGAPAAPTAAPATPSYNPKFWKKP